MSASIVQPLRLAAASACLQSGAVSSRALVEQCLERIENPSGEGRRTFLSVDPDGVRRAADSADGQLKSGGSPGPFAGIPVSVKDLFDIEGEVTRAGSVALSNAPRAIRDATAVARLRSAGFVIIGRTNMTEFAYSGLGINPHYGTPRNPWERKRGRIPGGSSSGAAISVTDGMAFAALGTDTGGSCRIPAAMTGLVAFKPTASHIPCDGVFPLSPSLDSVGVIAKTVPCCAAMYRVLAAKAGSRESSSRPLSRMRFLIPMNYVLDDLDEPVATAFQHAIQELAQSGALMEEVSLSLFEQLPAFGVNGGIVAAEAYAGHRALLDSAGQMYDPRIRSRILKGEVQTPAEYQELLAQRARFIQVAKGAMAAYDAILMPTTACVAPVISVLEASDEQYGRSNLLALRNAAIVNLFNGCAVSIPIHEPESAPVGLMLAKTADADESLLAVAAAVEALLSTKRLGGSQA